MGDWSGRSKKIWDRWLGESVLPVKIMHELRYRILYGVSQWRDGDFFFSKQWSPRSIIQNRYYHTKYIIKTFFFFKFLVKKFLSLVHLWLALTLNIQRKSLHNGLPVKTKSFLERTPSIVSPVQIAAKMTSLGRNSIVRCNRLCPERAALSYKNQSNITIHFS